MNIVSVKQYQRGNDIWSYVCTLDTGVIITIPHDENNTDYQFLKNLIDSGQIVPDIIEK